MLRDLQRIRRPPLMPPLVAQQGTPYDPSLPWELHPQVSLRPESFGALAYHFGTRRLSFLKSRLLLDVVRTLSEQPSGTEACRAAGVPVDQHDAYQQALGTLSESGMICRRRAS